MNDNLLVGLFALALVPLIAVRVWRGVREGRLPIYRIHLRRDDNRAKFAALLAVHALTLIVVAVIAADLLLGLGLRHRL
ncbi:MAG TPA: hypothetical protein VF702_04470 [Allosphingosinicella sp.]